jgi:hypothetical protein
MPWKHIAIILLGGLIGGLIGGLVGFVIMLTTSNKMNLLSPGFLDGALISELMWGFNKSTKP